ncbi:MAG: hypothetical protein OEU44_08430, partial [Gammaproteobacteria bacterium]|nr:hypothetical protein [Gammaproteobacteria bacterium]
MMSSYWTIGNDNSLFFCYLALALNQSRLQSAPTGVPTIVGAACSRELTLALNPSRLQGAPTGG